MDKLYKILEKMQDLLDSIKRMIDYKKKYTTTFFQTQDDRLQKITKMHDVLQKAINDTKEQIVLTKEEQHNEQMSHL